MKNFVAFYAAESDIELFDSREDAEKWLVDRIKEDGSNDGFSEETIQGKDFVAEILQRGYFLVDHSKVDYHEHTEECPEDCDEEEWGYGSEFDAVGHVEMVPANPGSIEHTTLDQIRESLKGLDMSKMDMSFMYTKDFSVKINKMLMEMQEANDKFEKSQRMPQELLHRPFDI